MIENNHYTYKIYSIDVWGNSEEGYERNDYYFQGEIEIGCNMENEEIIQLFIDEGYLKESAKDKVYIYDIGCGYIDILSIEDDYPLYELQIYDI